MERFKLTSGRWYACRISENDGGEKFVDYTPIKILSVDRVDGERSLELYFYHATYPEGVRDKQYQLSILSESSERLVAESRLHHPIRAIEIEEISSKWLRDHFPDVTPRGDLHEFLDRSC